MLFIIRQNINLFTKIIINNFAEVSWWSDTAEEIINSENTQDYILKNEKKIKKFIDELDKNRDCVINKDDTLSENEKKAIKNILLEVLNDDQVFEEYWLRSVQIINAINSYLVEKRYLVDKTNKKLNNMKDEEYIETKESKISSVESSYLWIFKSSSKGEKIENSANTKSLNTLLKTQDLNKLVIELREVLGVESFDKFEFKMFFWVRNYINVIPILEKYWYVTDWFFGINEAIKVISSIENVSNTQARISNFWFKDKLWIIFDYNIDWKLDNNNHFYTKELELFNAVKTEKEFENILFNLWYDWINEFNKEFETNYFKAREEFKERLWKILASENMIDPGKLLYNKDALKDHLNLMEQHKEKIEEEMEKMVKFDKIKKENKKFYEKIKLQAIWILVWAVSWIGSSFDVSELTKWILDSVQLGYFNWMPGFWIAKNIIKSEDWKYLINIWAINFVPYIAWSYKIYDPKIDEIKELFPDKINDKISVTVWGLFSVISAAWLDFSNVDENTKAWIKKMKKWMWVLLDKVFEKIKNWKKFEESWLGNIDNNKNTYERLESLYKSCWSSDLAINMLKKWALNNYERHLYEQAQEKWFVLTWISLWITSIFPVIWIHWEKNSIKWKQISEWNPYKANREAIAWLTKIESKEVVILKNINTYNIEAVEKTIWINENMSRLLHSDALRSRLTPWMMKLQKSIFDYNQWKKELNDVWKEFIKVFENKKIEEYAKKHNNEAELFTVRICFANSNPLEQNLIIKNVAANLMKKEWIEYKGNWKIWLKKLTLYQYDKKHNRANFFDKLFAKELPDLAQRIKIARKNYNLLHWNVEEYEYWVVNDEWWVGFSWVEVRRTKETWINRYVWWYHYAKMPQDDEGNDNSFIPIEWKSIDLVNSLPDLVINNFKIQLEWIGIKLKNNNKVKEFINNGWDNSTKVDYKIFFAKDPECLNDKIILKDLIITKTSIVQSTTQIPGSINITSEVGISTNLPEYDTDLVALWVTLGHKKKDDDEVWGWKDENWSDTGTGWGWWTVDPPDDPPPPPPDF